MTNALLGLLLVIGLEPRLLPPPPPTLRQRPKLASKHERVPLEDPRSSELDNALALNRGLLIDLLFLRPYLFLGIRPALHCAVGYA